MRALQPEGESMRTESSTTKRNPERSPTPHGGSVDMKEKMGWSTVDQSGVPYLANKKELHIDSAYQRTMLSETRVAAITQSWSWLACGSLIVSERPDGSLFVIDGQHRFTAAQRRSDIQELPCLVFKHESVAHEALAFYRANCIRGNVSPFDKLRALTEAEEPLALDAIALMQSEGYAPSNSDATNTVRCITTFMSALKLHRGALARVWPLIAQLHDGLSIRKKVFAALFYIARFGSDDITKPEWKARVLKRGLHEIEESIDMLSKLKSAGSTKVSAWAALEVINRGVPRSKRLELEETTPDEA